MNMIALTVIAAFALGGAAGYALGARLAEHILREVVKRWQKM